jgi:hypothetical protein
LFSVWSGAIKTAVQDQAQCNQNKKYPLQRIRFNHTPKRMIAEAPVADTTRWLSGYPDQEPLPEIDTDEIGPDKWVLFDNDLTFDPQFRFSLEGKPWAFIFWWRYKLLKKGKFRLNVGAHPAILFADRTVSTGGTTREIIEGRRYLAAEISPGYAITENVMVGMYYLHSHGLEKDVTRQVHFLTLRTILSDLKLTEKFSLHITPQLYYLKLDEQDGFYFTSEFTITREDFPFSISSEINKRIRSNITIGSEFAWNLTLTYTFDRQYVRFLNKSPQDIASL